MGYNIGPKIGIEGEAEFRRQIREINAEYKTLEAETRALTAAFEANGDEQGKLEASSKQLEKQIETQKRKMGLLEDAVSKASNQYGENSIEANRLRGVLFDTQAAVAGLENELQDINSRLNQAADGMEQFGDEAENAGEAALSFRDVLKADLIADVAQDALYELADAVAEFAKGMPDAAAEVAAANSKFEQTFGELEGSASRALESISEDTKIAVTRLQGDYTKLYAFTKSVGGDSEEALDIAGRAMRAAADNAAYFDKSIEEATEQIQSFIKGNYENDAALGIAATETTRNAKANEMYAKSFNDLSEAQKVDVLLAMVEAGNEASGALGQAAREAASWTNVQGELDEAMKQFQATLGQPVLAEIIPIIQDITAGIYELMEATEAERLAKEMDTVVNAWENAEAQFEQTSQEIEINAIMAKAYADRLVDLENTGLETAESQREYANTVRALNELMPELNLEIDEQTGLLDMNTGAIYSQIEAMRQKALYAAYEEEYTAILKAQGQAKKVVAESEYRLTQIETERTGIIQQLTDSTGMEIGELIQLYNAQQTVNAAMQGSVDTASSVAAGFIAAGQSAQTLSAEEILLIETLLSLNQEEDALNGTLSETNDAIGAQESELNELLEIMGLMPEKAEDAAEGQDRITESVQGTEAAAQKLQEEYEATVTSARESIESQIGLFDELAEESEMSARDIIENWGNQRRAFDNYTANMQKALDMGLDQTLVQQLSDGSEQSMLILDELVNSTDTNVDEINEAFQELGKAKDATAEAMAQARDSANAEMDNLAADAATWGDDIVDGAVAGVNANAYRFHNAMHNLGVSGANAFRIAMDINSPSRVMVAANEYVVDGGVQGVLENIEKYEEAMSELATAGYRSFLNERIEMAEEIPGLMNVTFAQSAKPQALSVSYGDFNIHIYQKPEEDAENLAHRVMDVIQAETQRKEAALRAYQ